MSDTDLEKVSVTPGTAILGCFVTGGVGIFLAVQNGDGLGLIGPALAFGAVVVASFRP